MTDHRIESLRQNAALLTDCGLVTAAGVLLREADRIEREQADEKRIDDYAEEAYRAAGVFLKSGTNWARADDRAKDCYRAVVRAVLAKRDEDRAEWGKTIPDGPAYQYGRDFTIGVRK
ncbi:hypothetical protein [Rhodococcus artemisiae]|uniref:Excreted virulence factor EspC (Type VII ESX diderm) n=1 Tax=Rhodococcus artemisiae TaxID=714159 RepID=A0ABU7LBM4_9NOCA|nr:hypothetical protein [Rhodococcus artemisiae]MEE2058946.1 hypothetical protein [Rhodococcus artemisiae]